MSDSLALGQGRFLKGLSLPYVTYNTAAHPVAPTVALGPDDVDA
jgi:hypothetical protein